MKFILGLLIISALIYVIKLLIDINRVSKATKLLTEAKRDGSVLETRLEIKSQETKNDKIEEQIKNK